MAKEVWALDLGDWSLKVARGHYDSGSEQIVLNLYEELRFSSLGLQEDAAQMEKYRVGLEEFEKRFDVGASDELCVAVSGSEVFSRFINLPPVPESISEIITYEARQQIPFDIDDVVWDYQPLKEEHQPGEEIEVGLFALKRDSIDELMELLEPWKHNLRVIQDGPLAVYNMLVFEGHTDGASIVIDMGARSTDVLVLNHPRFWMRPLLIGANGITERLKSHFGVSWQEAERIKERASERDREAQLLRIVQPVVENIVSEIQRSLGYYKSLSKGVQIQKIWAVGNAFKLKGLDRVLGDNLQYDVEKPEVLQNFDIASSVDGKRLRSYIGGACAALGLLVQGTG
ncbi:MAG: pilus assembly protein PilM, partial [Planctomycetota bacterium]